MGLTYITCVAFKMDRVIIFFLIDLYDNTSVILLLSILTSQF